MPAKPSALIDTRVIYCGDNLDQFRKLPEACIDLVYIDPPFNSNRNYEVFWGETKEKRSFEDQSLRFDRQLDSSRLKSWSSLSTVTVVALRAQPLPTTLYPYKVFAPAAASKALI